MSVKNITSKVKNALSWTFNNNGHQVDKTRRRLSDGSPIHSTGTTRLRSQWPYAVAVIPSIAIMALTNGKNWALASLIVSTLFVAFDRLILRKKFMEGALDTFGKDAEKLCINTKPDETTKPALSPDENQLLSEDFEEAFTDIAKKSLYFLPVVGATLGYWTASKEDAYHATKIKSGEWVIEEMPPPEKKKQEKEVFTPELEAA